jgi:xanthine dehydrogenase FAD-binding subunit
MKQVLFPTSFNELFQLLADLPESRIMAGGTDLLVSLRTANGENRPLIAMERMEELSTIAEQANGGVSIGACVTFSRIITHPLLVDRYPILTQAAGCVGGPAIRNMATLGGNIASASPAGDSLPPLYLLAAVLEISAATGSRRLPIDQFICSPRKILLQPGEIISRILLPPAEEWDLQRFEKVGKRKSLAIAVASLAAMIRLQGGHVVEARLAWGSVGPTVFRCPVAEQSLLGHPLSGESLSVAADSVRETVQPIDDLRASAAYRRTVAGNLLLRLSA